MPALTQTAAAKPGLIATYVENLSNWLRTAASDTPTGPKTATGDRPDGPRLPRAKRAVDVVGAAVLLALLLPILAAILAVVWATGGSPIYGQQRVGRGGRPFRCWKVRTMVPDAEARLAGILRSDPERAAEWARDHKLRNDPRVTRVGRVLRRTGLDELPQLWNILAGDMSLVGPRPVTGPEMVRYGASARYYLAVRPGLTGLWQLEGRNDVPYRRRVLLDRFYVSRPSLRRDLALICRTPAAIARRTGR